MALDTAIQRSRRALLLGAVGGVAALAAQAFGRAPGARAADPNDIVLGGNNQTTATTRIENVSTHNDLLRLQAFGNGYALEARATNDNGVLASSVTAPGVTGSSDSGPGVEALSNSGVGLSGRSNSVQGVHGRGAIGVEGVSTYSGMWGVFGSNQEAQGIGVGGQADSPSAIGVLGASTSGRGGEFHGGKAQLRFVPSAAGTHPFSGKAGDVFVDASKRVWFCKGSTTWVRQLDT